MPSTELLQAVAVTAELCGRTFSEAAARVFVDDLSIYPEQAVIKALSRCRREVRGFLTIADVVCRLDDGRPGVEEAWAMMPFDESQSVVWSDEMAAAYGVALPLIESGDKVAARMAFKESYVKEIASARDAGRPVKWSPSLGHDKTTHKAALTEAVTKGRLSLEHARLLIPNLEAPSQNILALASAAIEKPGSEAACSPAPQRACSPA